MLALISLTAKAQQEPMYTHYMYNTANINPAYAGSRGTLSVYGMRREQWIGLKGAPKTNAFSLSTPFKNSNLGLGISFVNDEIGAMKENNFSFDLSYTIKLKRSNNLAFGLKGTASLLDVNYSNLLVHNPNDPKVNIDIKNQFTPNFGAGIYYYNSKSYIGLSVPNILETDRYNDNIYATLKTRMHYYLMGGHVFNINPNLKFKPAVLLKAVDGAPLQSDITANFLFSEKLTLGASYRINAAWGALAAFQISDGLMIGYSYDGDTTKLAHYNSGSHEIFLRFELFKKYDRLMSPRFF